MDQPSWMAEECPAWCVREHAEDDHPEDQRHQGRAIEVDAVLASDAVPGAAGTPTSLVVQLDQPVGGRTVWLRIEASEAAQPRFAVRAADAIELASALFAAVTP